MFANTPLEELYLAWYSDPSTNFGDTGAFYHHMPTLRHMCRNKNVLELGARYGVSTLAILAGKPTMLITVDIEKRKTIDTLLENAKTANIPFFFYEMDDFVFPAFVGSIPIVDILFIDTLHTYEQLSKELAIYGDCAREYIVLHDIVSFGQRNEDDNPNGPQGLLPAIEEFLTAHHEWVVDSFYFNCNGLMILRRK